MKNLKLLDLRLSSDFFFKLAYAISSFFICSLRSVGPRCVNALWARMRRSLWNLRMNAMLSSNSFETHWIFEESNIRTRARLIDGEGSWSEMSTGNTNISLVCKAERTERLFVMDFLDPFSSEQQQQTVHKCDSSAKPARVEFSRGKVVSPSIRPLASHSQASTLDIRVKDRLSLTFEFWGICIGPGSNVYVELYAETMCIL